MIPTVTILNAIKARLEAAKWTPQGGAEEPAFGDVRLFDVQDIAAAFTELLVSKSRVAFVIYVGGRWEPAGASYTTGSRRVVEIGVLVSDRVIGKKLDAQFGATANPGAVPLMEITARALIGRLIENPPCDCRPVADETADATDLKTKQPGRFASYLTLEVSGGILEVPDQFSAAA
jgi:hypothetical protein